jgi:hypothetical protein
MHCANCPAGGRLYIQRRRIIGLRKLSIDKSNRIAQSLHLGSHARIALHHMLHLGGIVGRQFAIEVHQQHRLVASKLIEFVLHLSHVRGLSAQQASQP